MKNLFMICMTGALLASSVWAQGSDSEQYFRAKYGRNSPAEEARQKAAQANSAWRQEALPEVAAPNDSWTEQLFRAKYGRNSPKEEARQDAAQANTAWREEATTKVIPNVSWPEQFYRAKYGRSLPSGAEEPRR